MLDVLGTGGLSGHGLVLLIFTAAVFAVFIWDRFPIASVCLAILVALPLLFLAFPYSTPTGTVDPFSVFAGFAHPALLAICSLMILGHALVLTGALEPAARHVSALVATRPGVALLVVLIAAGGASGFVNDTPVVVLLIPLLIAAMRRANASPATVLLPMNYAVLIGGMATTIGTSTNLIVVSMAQQLGQPPLGMLSFYPLVATAAVPALLYLWIVAPRLLRDVEPPGTAYSEPVFDAELRVEPDSWMEGKQLHEVLTATQRRMRILDIRSHDGISRVRLPNLELAAGDHIQVQDTVENLKEFETVLHAKLHGVELEEDEGDEPDGQAGTDGRPPREPADAPVDPAVKKSMLRAQLKGALPADASKASPRDETGNTAQNAGKDTTPKADEAHPDLIVAQFVVTPRSPLEGRTVSLERLAERYRLVVVGLRPVRAGRGWAREKITDRVLGAGDILLVQGSEEQLRAAQQDGVGLLLDSRHVVPRSHKAWLALSIMAVVVLLAATKAMPIALAALAGAFTLLVTRCLSWRDLGAALSSKVIMLVTASLALGNALSVTGGTAFLAGQLVGLTGFLEPRYVLALLMLLMGLFTNFVSNNAAAAIGTPLGIEMALKLGVPPEPYVLAVLFGCNLCYVTPMAYQTNLLVMNATGYRFVDFVKVGAPLFLIMWLGLCTVLAVRYGL